jgi:D-sedoheptulose 7-phosphate isomerase
MNDQEFLDDYFAHYRRVIETDVRKELLAFRDLCQEIQRQDKKLMIAGNGASASIASHAATDFTKQAKVRAMAFNDHNLVTAFSNDYGYENWVAEAIRAYGKVGDAVVLISSSGKSQNMVNAAEAARGLGLPVITFTGFLNTNPLSQKGLINFWVDSKAYNIIESLHGIWICTVVDMLVGSAEYGVN